MEHAALSESLEGMGEFGDRAAGSELVEGVAEGGQRDCFGDDETPQLHRLWLKHGFELPTGGHLGFMEHADDFAGELRAALRSAS